MPEVAIAGDRAAAAVFGIARMAARHDDFPLALRLSRSAIRLDLARHGERRGDGCSTPEPSSLAEPRSPGKWIHWSASRFTRPTDREGVNLCSEPRIFLYARAPSPEPAGDGANLWASKCVGSLVQYK